jgi:uncharacterized membrane protein
MVARLEAFSDIVIGFSLAQASINLVAVSDIAAFFRHPIAILAYLVTFSIVARIWWQHSRIMHGYFVLNRVMITLNFVVLAAVGLTIFALQLWMRNGMDESSVSVALDFYMICFAVLISAIGAMRAAGVRYRWEHLSPDERRAAVSRSLVEWIISLAVTVGVVLPSPKEFFGVTTLPLQVNVVIALAIGIFAARVARRLFERSDFGNA